MAHYHFEQESCDTTAVEDLASDSGNFTLSGVSAVPNCLRDQFVRRMSQTLNVSISPQSTVGRSLDALLSYSSRSRLTKQEELVRIEQILASIATHTRDFAIQSLKDDLWDIILIMSYDGVHAVILRLQRNFKCHLKIFGDIVAKTCGIHFDNDNCDVDYTLGDYIIKLSQAVEEYDKSMKKANNLISLAFEITKEPNLQERLNDLIGNTLFASELLELIYKLGVPKESYSTLVSATTALRTFENITFGDKKISLAADIQKDQPLESNKAICMKRTDNQASSPPLPAKPIPGSLGPLPATDSVQPLHKREPGTKRDVALLIETVSHGNLLPKHESAWYSFGFVCTQDEEEERRLAGLYSVIIQEANSFCELQHALETHTLVVLFDTKGYSNFRKLFPYLEAFLTGPPEQRLTVWRLKQFIHDTDNTNPPACLQRDYGFKFCKFREEVVRLKTIYSKVLDTMEPKNLHSACVHGRLFETAMCAGVSIHAKDKRLMQNDYPSPFVGFDNNAGLANYRRSLFKKQQKMWY